MFGTFIIKEIIKRSCVAEVCKRDGGEVMSRRSQWKSRKSSLLEKPVESGVGDHVAWEEIIKIMEGFENQPPLMTD